MQFYSIGVSPKSALFHGRIFGNTTQTYAASKKVGLCKKKKSITADIRSEIV